MAFSGRQPVPLGTPDLPNANAPARQKAEGRKVYSPDVLGDPYVLQEHQKIVEALELSCRQTGKACVEADEGRRYLVLSD
jgi:hypothetical protein